MRKVIALLVVCGSFAATATPLAFANPNPSGTGPPSQSCQELNPTSPIPPNPYAPGHAQESPGSPFNERGENSVNGGTGGQHYSEKAQYDVACYQHQQHAEAGH
jgi:hypothetical protein